MMLCPEGARFFIGCVVGCLAGIIILSCLIIAAEARHQ